MGEIGDVFTDPTVQSYPWYFFFGLLLDIPFWLLIVFNVKNKVHEVFCQFENGFANLYEILSIWLIFSKIGATFRLAWLISCQFRIKRDKNYIKFSKLRFNVVQSSLIFGTTSHFFCRRQIFQVRQSKIGTFLAK